VERWPILTWKSSGTNWSQRANQHQLQIEFFGLGFGSGQVLRYQYELEGADRDWSPPTDQRSVNYANLAPGSYRFLVRAVTADGLVSPSPATISFTILPPVWRRWWFIALAVTALALIVYSLYRYRVAQLIALERVRTRIATDLHDDIGSVLSQDATPGASNEDIRYRDRRSVAPGIAPADHSAVKA
jgi:hypothetical protein